MKALVYLKYGQPKDIFQIKELSKPTPKDNEILVKVYNTTVNRTDEGITTARYVVSRLYSGLFKPKKQVPGTDFAGVVEHVGNSVTFFKQGDAVFGFNDEGLSSQAEYLVIAEGKHISKMPTNISFEQAAASLEGAHYAINFINKTNLQKGDKVLVNGATGAIGSAAVQLLKSYGCYVVAVCDTENMGLIASLGVDRTIDYKKEDFTTDKERFSFVYDAVGKSSFRKCKSLLIPNGVYISSELGWMASNLFYALFTPIFGGKKVVFPIPTNISVSIKIIKNLIEQDQFRPVIDRIYELQDIIEAYDYVQTGMKTGNVIIKINS